MSVTNKVTNGIKWQMLERILTAVVQFVISVVLARLVLPDEYGIISLVTVFVTLADLLVTSGFGTALIQKKNIDDSDVNTVFTFSTIVAIGVWLLLFFTSPFVADFYGIPVITTVLRVYALIIWPSAIGGLLRSLYMRELKFKALFLVSAIPMVVSGVVGVVVALYGGGVYALVIQNLVNAYGALILVWCISKRKLRLRYCKERIAELWKYSWKLLIANIADVAYKNIYTLCIPKFYNDRVLGFYSYGRQIPNVIFGTFNSAMVASMFPVFARKQEDISDLKGCLRKTIRSCNFFYFPIMIGITALARSIIIILLGKEWIESAWYLQFFCIVYGLHHIQNLNFQAISACGKSDVFLKYEMMKKIVGIVILAVTLPLGIEWVMWGQVANITIAVLMNIYPNKKWLQYKLGEQIRDIVPYVIIVMFMFLAVKGCGILLENMNFYLCTVLQVLVGIMSYMLAAWIFRIEELKETWNIIKSKIKNRD
ncbi:MAG: lipopolysaccharide biosynthesis protein [Lachnospiraceae bacterium]|nr:lipopolysaccharide biosynthesis protein [Lachnospiraceae bacterium]